MKILFNKYPLDIIICIICSIVLLPIILLNLNDTLRIVLGLPFIIFIPGYLLLIVLIPIKNTDKVIDLIERIALSFGISLAIVAITGITLYYTIGKIQSESALIFLFTFEIILGFISLYRWFKTNSDERFIISINISKIKLKDSLKSKDKYEKILIALLIFLILTTVTLFVYVVKTPRSQEKFSSFYLLSSDRTTNYPSTINAGENITIIIGVTNHEYKIINYTIEVWLLNQTLTFNESKDTNIIIYKNAWFMKKINTTLKHNDKETIGLWEPQWEYNYTFNVSKRAENLTLTFLLFKDTTENYDYYEDYKQIIQKKIDNAYEDLYLWITVE